MKTEMNGTGGGRWTTREDAKQTSKKLRRQIDRSESFPARGEEPCTECGRVNPTDDGPPCTFCVG